MQKKRRSVFSGLPCLFHRSKVWPEDQGSKISIRSITGYDSDECRCLRYTVTSKTEKRRHTIKIGAFCLIISSLIAAAVLYAISVDFRTFRETQELTEQYQSFLSEADHLVAYLRCYCICFVQNSTRNSDESRNSNLTLNQGIFENNSEKLHDFFVRLLNASLNECADSMMFDCFNFTLFHFLEMSEKVLQTLNSLVIASASSLQDSLTVHKQHYSAIIWLYRELSMIAAQHHGDDVCHYAKQNYLKTKQFVSSLLFNLDTANQSIDTKWQTLVQTHEEEENDITCANMTSRSNSYFFEQANGLIKLMYHIDTYLLKKRRESNGYFASQSEETTIKLAANSSILVLLTLLIAVVIVVVNAMNEWMYEFSKHIKDKSVELKAQKQFADNLLYQMLPPFIAKQLMTNKPVKAESFDCVSIFFSDIVGFTEIAAKSTPFQVVDLLNDLYSKFDIRIETYDVYKVETIGDAYMVASGVPVRNGDKHVEEISTMSIDLLSAIKQVKNPRCPEHNIHIRIGIHTGACCAGIVGKKMPRYCLFGDTVNTASRMESTSLPLMIHVSKATRDLLERTSSTKYHLTSRGLTEIKGKGLMETFWLHTRSDMSEVNDSMVCKYIPKKRKPKISDTGPKQNGLDTIPETISCSTPERGTATTDSIRRDSSVSDTDQKCVQLIETSSVNNFLKTDSTDYSVYDVSSVTNSESEMKAVFDDGYTTDIIYSDAEYNAWRLSNNKFTSVIHTDTCSTGSDGTQRSANNDNVTLEIQGNLDKERFKELL